MKYIGYIKPFVPVNAFLESIYQDENNILHVHKIVNNIIEGFEKINIPITDITRVKLPVDVAEKSPAIFSFVKCEINSRDEIVENLLYGTYDELFFELCLFTKSKKEDIVARIITSEFCCLHSFTKRLIKKARLLGELIEFSEKSFLPFNLLKNCEKLNSLIKEVLKKRQNCSDCSVEDFIYINEDYLFIGDYKVSFDTVAKYVDKEDDFDLRGILLDLFDFYEIFTMLPDSIGTRDLLEKDVFWLYDLVKVRAAAARLNDIIPTTNFKSIAEIAYSTENKMSELTSYESDSIPNMERLRFIKNTIPNKLKRLV